MIDTANNKITDYQIVDSTAVKAQLAAGWVLYGAPFYVTSGKFSQALVKVQVAAPTVKYS